LITQGLNVVNIPNKKIHTSTPFQVATYLLIWPSPWWFGCRPLFNSCNTVQEKLGDWYTKEPWTYIYKVVTTGNLSKVIFKNILLIPSCWIYHFHTNNTI